MIQTLDRYFLGQLVDYKWIRPANFLDEPLFLGVALYVSLSIQIIVGLRPFLITELYGIDNLRQ